MYIKMVFQGTLGAPVSRLYRSFDEWQRVQNRLDALEINVSRELSTVESAWPELEVLMFFLWSCDESDDSMPRVRHIKADRLLQVSACMDPEVFLKASVNERADLAFSNALMHFAQGFSKYGKDARELELLRDRLFGGKMRATE